MKKIVLLALGGIAALIYKVLETLGVFSWAVDGYGKLVRVVIPKEISTANQSLPLR